MNNHKTACLVIVVFIAGMLYGVNELRNASGAARDSAEAAQSNAENAERQAELASIQLKSLEAKTADLRGISSDWKPYFNDLSTPQAAEQRVVDVIRESGVFMFSQKFEPRQLDKDALISEALVANLIVKDSYTKAINWIGLLEQEIPNSRITECRIEPGERGNNIHLELQIMIPVLKN